MDYFRLRRELRRVYLKLRLWPDRLIGRWRKAQHDRNRASRLLVSQGRAAMQADLAILLLYQPKGLLASTFATCRYLAAQGFAVIAVSNAPLSPPDGQRLQDVCLATIERPNFGYDFGGYRDGILHALDSGLRPDNLLVLNDSIWFPVMSDSPFLSDLRAQTADLYGPILNRGHLHSYMFSFKRRVVESPEFRAYWQDLALTDNKVGVVRDCEMRLSPSFEAMGFKVGTRAGNAELVKAILDLPNEELAGIIDYDLAKGTRLSRKIAGLRHEGEGWAETARDRIRAAEGQRYLLKNHPDLLLGPLGLPILKKDRGPEYVRQRQALLRGKFLDRLAPEVRAEIESWDRA